MQVARHLIAAGHVVHIVTGAPDFVFTSEIRSPNLHIRKVGSLIHLLYFKMTRVMLSRHFNAIYLNFLFYC